MAQVVYKSHTIMIETIPVGQNFKRHGTVTPPTDPALPKIAPVDYTSTSLFSSATAPGMVTQQQAWINQQKAAIDAAVVPGTETDWTGWTGTETPPPTDPGTTPPATEPPTTPTSNPGEWDYPMPTIVFGTAAEVPQAWPQYQEARNNSIWQTLYNDMITQVYTTWTQAQIVYYQKLMAFVNSHGWNIQINIGSWDANFWQITSTDDWDYANTSAQIRNKIWQLAWVWSWDEFALKTQQWTWTGTWTGTGWTTTAWDLESGSEAVDNTFQNIQETALQMQDWLTNTFNANLADRQSRMADMPDVQANISDRLTSMNTAFQSAAGNLQAAWELERKAQAIYSNENINQMKQQLISKGFDASKAWPAVFFKAMQDRAKMSAEIYKLMADEEKTLATLETQRAQLVDGIKAAGLEADQWVFSQLNEITKQIENLRTTYDTQRMNVLWQYTLAPMLDVMSNQFQADFQNIVDKYQEQFLNANPSQKIVAAARIFSNDRVYVSQTVAMNTSGTFGEYLARCAESIRVNKLAAETQVAWAWADVTNVSTWWISYA